MSEPQRFGPSHDLHHPLAPGQAFAAAAVAETKDQKLARLRADKLKRDEAAREEAKDREIEALELDERMAREFGKRGVSYQLVTTSEGPIGLKLGEPLAWKQFMATYKKDSEPTLEEIDGFVIPCVTHPSADKVQDMLFRRKGLATVLAGALADLYQAKEIDTRGK